MRPLSYLAPLCTLLLLGSYWYAKTYHFPDISGHWHIHYNYGEAQPLDLLPEGTDYEDYPDDLPGYGGLYHRLGRTLRYGPSCLGHYNTRYRMVDDSTLALKFGPDEPYTAFLRRPFQCTAYDHWLMNRPFPITLPSFPSTAPAVAQNDRSLIRTIAITTRGDGYYRSPNDLEFYLSDKRLDSLNAGDLSLFTEMAMVKLPEAKRPYATVFLAAGKHVPLNTIHDAVNRIKAANRHLGYEHNIWQLGRDEQGELRVQILSTESE